MENNIKHLLFFLCALTLLSSCEKDEIPLKYQPPTLEQGTFNRQVHMGSNYKHRIYYDLERDSIVSQHFKTDWDLAFSCSEEEFIKINGSKLMTIWKVENATLDDVLFLQGEGPLVDHSSGSPRALDTWSSDDVYIVDRGFNEEAQTIGRYKMKILAINDEQYQIQYGPLNSSEYSEATIAKEAGRNLVHFSFDEGRKVLEPHQEDWDILFTHYTFYFEDEELPYLVAGALINPYMTEGASLDRYVFDEIDAEYLATTTYGRNQDVIGYDWKIFDLDTQTYTILDNAYAIRSVEGNRYKLQFTSFVDAEGQKGSPAFRAALVP